MKILVQIPIDVYHACAGRFAPSSWEYKILKNGVIEHNELGEEVVEILCEAADCQSFQQALITACPEAEGKITERFDRPN
jgi:hypothetical protein